MDAVKRRRFGRQQGAPARPAEAAGWVGRAYGQRAAELITELANTMRAAETESKVPRAELASELHAGTDRRSLHEDLLELRGVVLTADVCDADHDRDLHLRAALSAAIGAASGLASASHTQPTAAYLSVARPAIDDVLIAAGEPIV